MFAAFQKSKMSSPWPYGEEGFLKYLHVKIPAINLNDVFNVRFKVAYGIIFC